MPVEAPEAVSDRPGPDLSFIVAAHDAAPWIEAAIGSALAQTGIAVEVVVVDDASRDDTAARVRAIAARDRRVVPLCRAAGGGPSAARNLALAHARGTWVAILDADDEVLPERGRDLIALARRSYCAVAADNVVRFLDGDPARSRPLLPDLPKGGERRVDLAGYLRGNRLTGGATNLGYLKPVVLRAFLDAHAIRYDEGLRIGEDFHFCLRCLAAGTDLAISGRAGYRYRLHATSLSRRLSSADLHAMRTAYDALPARGDWSANAELRRADAGYRRSLDALQTYVGVREGLRAHAWLSVLRGVAGPGFWLTASRFGGRALRRRMVRAIG